MAEESSLTPDVRSLPHLSHGVEDIVGLQGQVLHPAAVIVL